MRNKRIQGIYSITHSASGRIYIGSSRYVVARWNYHRNRLKLGTHDNPYLQRAWMKYGETAFEWRVEETVEHHENLLDREQFLIDKFDACNRSKGFNIRPKANGYALAEETKQKISERAKGRKSKLTGKRFSNKLTQDDHKAIKYRLAAWETLQSIADDFNVGVTTIIRIARRENGWDILLDPETEAKIDARPKQSPFRKPTGYVMTLEIAHTIKQLSRDGMTPDQIARNLGLKYATVYAVTSGRTWRHVV